MCYVLQLSSPALSAVLRLANATSSDLGITSLTRAGAKWINDDVIHREDIWTIWGITCWNPIWKLLWKLENLKLEPKACSDKFLSSQLRVLTLSAFQPTGHILHLQSRTLIYRALETSSQASRMIPHRFRTNRLDAISRFDRSMCLQPFQKFIFLR